MSGAETAPGSRFLDPRYTAAVVFGAHDWTEVGMSRAPSFLRSAKGVVAYLIDSASLGLDPTLVTTVLQLPVAPRTPEEAEEQKRVAVV